MSRFVKEINDSTLAAERAEKDILGNKIDTTYQHKLTAGSNISINEVTNTISAQVPPDFSSVIPSDASSSNKLVSTNTLDTRLANFGGFKEVQGTGTDLHPNVPSGEEDSKLIYLVKDDTATGDDKYKEWIWDSGDSESDPPVSAQWKLIGDTTMNLDGKADKVQNATSGNLAALDSSGNLTDSGVDPSQLDGNLKQGLQGLQGTKIPAKSDLNDYTSPGNYYIESAPDMAEIFHTPFTQMGFSSSETGKTGASQVTVYNMTGTASGRVMQVMYTIYSTNPTGDNAFGFWYRMSAGGSQQTWGDWHRMLQTNGFAPYRYGSTTPSTATKSAELLKVKVGATTTYLSLTIAVTISGAASNQNMFVLATLSIRGNTPKIEAEVINHNFSSLDIGRVRFYAQNDSNLVTTYGIMFPDKDDLTYANITYIVLSHTGSLYESTVFPSFNNVWLLYNPILSSSTPTYTVYTDLYSKNSHHGPGLWCGTKKKTDYLLITVSQISGGTTIDSILISFAGNQYGVMMKLCFGMASGGGFSTVPILHVLECNNLSNAAYNPLFTSGGGVAKYYYDSTNKLCHFLLQTTTENRMMCTVESANTENYYFDVIDTEPSWLSSASDIAKGHSIPHITESSMGQQIGSSTKPVYVDAGGGIVACTYSIAVGYSSENNTICFY